MEPKPSITIDGGGMVVILRPDAVRAACVARGWSLAQLGRESRLSRPTVIQALRGRPIRPRTAWKIARALSTVVSDPMVSDLMDS